jgi:hypothetical protein
MRLLTQLSKKLTLARQVPYKQVVVVPPSNLHLGIVPRVAVRRTAAKICVLGWN